MSDDIENGILFLGDVFLDRLYDVDLTNKYPIVFNLEAPISTRGRPIEGKINLKCQENLIAEVFKPLPLAVCLANNHIMDYGNDAFEDTIEILEDYGIGYFGAGKKEENYKNPLIISLNGQKIGMLGYCYSHFYDQISHVTGLEYGPAPLEEELIKMDVANLKGKVDRIILHFHWGMENSNLPSIDHIKLARKISEIDVNCIVGHHAHTVQPVEELNNTIIAYGLGNFIFGDLDIPTYFDKEGEFTKRLELKQRIWNRSSIGLVVDVDSPAYSIYCFFQKGDRVIARENKNHRYSGYKIPKNFYKFSDKIDQHLKFKRIANIILKFIDHPKIPKLKSIGNFMRELTHLINNV